MAAPPLPLSWQVDLLQGNNKLHLIFQGPSVLFGAIAKNTNWEAAGYLCGAPSDESDDSTPTKVGHGI